MRTLHRLLKRLWIGLFFVGAMVLAGNVKVQLSSTQIAKGQNVVVKIIAEGRQVEFPVIRSIGNYPVENLRKSSKIETRIVNGNISTRSKKILSFEFYPEKTVTLPTFKVLVDGKELQTKPVTIKVVEGGAGKGVGPAGGFTLQMHLDKKRVYVGEPLILTVDAAEPIHGSIVQMQYNPPEFKEFFVKPLGGENQIRKGDLTIHELKYLLIPNKAGTITIPPAQVRVGIRDLHAVSDPFGIFGTPVKWYAIRSVPLHLQVEPLPAAVDLVGSFRIKGGVDKRKVQANKPVNYTLTITGEGSLEDLADPVFDIPGVTVYSDDAQVESRIVNGKLESKYVKSYAFISDRDFTIPSLKLKVFDPKSGKVQSISTREIPIQVEGGAAASAPRTGRATSGAQPKASSVKQSAQGAGKSGTPIATAKKRTENPLSDEAYYAKRAYEEKAAKLPWYLLIAYLGGVASTFLILWVYRRLSRGSRGIVRRRHYGYEEALKILYPHINEDPEAERMVRELYRIKAGEKVDLDRGLLDRLAARYDREEGK